MPKSLLKSAVLGGLVVFVWGMISWMVLPIHQHCFHKFMNEERVASVIRDNVSEKGMYVLPTDREHKGCSSSEKGPYMFASVVPQGLGQKMAKPLIFSLVIQIVGALIVSWLLMRSRGLSFRKKVLFVTLFGLGVGILGYFPAWNWSGFSGPYVVGRIFDLLVGWCLAGLVIAKTLKVAK